MSSTRKFLSGKQVLLIGNNQYQRKPLHCCINDATDLGNKLESIGFQVTRGFDMDYEKMDRLIDEFVNKIRSGDLILFYFSGHGTQWNDQNFLIPIDNDQIRSRTDLKYRAIHAQQVLEKIINQQASAVIFLLDCCRSYCVPNEAATKSIDTKDGLSSMQAVVGSFIAFACDANKTASDGSKNRRNGIFTAHLLNHITQPNMTIDDIMTDVCHDVMTESNNQQCPFRVSSLRQKVYLNQQASSSSSSSQPQLPVVQSVYKNTKLESIIARYNTNPKIDLSKQNLTDNDMEIIVKHAIHEKRCVHLWLSSNSITLVGVSILANGLKTNYSLERLDLYQNKIRDEGVRILTEVLSDGSHALKILNLGNNEITDQGAIYLAQMLERNRLLTHIFLHNNHLSNDGIQQLAKAIANQNKTLKELYLNGNRLINDLSIDYLWQMIKKHPELSQLHIEDCDLSPTGKEKLKNIAKLKSKFQVFVNDLFS